MNSGNDFFGWKYLLHIPAIRAAHIHKFNKTQNDAATFKVLSHCNNLMIVGTFFHHHIDFDVLEACFLCCGNSIKYIGDWEIDIIHFLEDRIIQTIKTYCQSLQTGCF